MRSSWNRVKCPCWFVRYPEWNMRRWFKAVHVFLLAMPCEAFACEQTVVLSERLQVDDPGAYYLVRIQRAHGDNLVGTITRSFGGTVAAGQTVSIQSTQDALADATCALEFSSGKTYLLKTQVRGGALQISRYNSHNVAADHERFATYVRDIETAAAGLQ